MKRLAILGASGHGKVVADIAHLSDWNEIVFFDDAWPERKLNGIWPVIGNSVDLLDNISQYAAVFVAIGDNQTRMKKLEMLDIAHAPIINLIHPSAMISEYVQFGKGISVMPGAVINIDVNVDDGAIINSGATVDHDSSLGRCSHISPGANLAGNVSVGDCSWVGIGAAIRQNITIGNYVTIGAGAVVINNIDDNKTAVGIPAVNRTE